MPSRPGSEACDYHLIAGSLHPRNAALWLLVATAYFVAGKLGLALAVVNASASAVWPPTGIAVAAILVFGPRVWPGIFLGAFLANEMTAGTVLTSLAIAAGNTSEAIVAGYLVRRFAGGCAAFNRGRDLARFVVLAGLVSPVVSATVGVTTLSIAGYAAWPLYGTVWLTWWLGDATGAIAITPVLVLWAGRPDVIWSRRQLGEGLALLLTLVASGWVVFVETPYPLEFLCLPLCVWAAFRFGQRGAATATCLLSGIAVWGTVRGLGSFGHRLPNEALLLMQVFLAVTTIVGLAISAAVSERRDAEARVQALNEDLEQRVGRRTADLQAAHDDMRAGEARLAEAQAVGHIGSWEWVVPENRGWWSKELYRIVGADRDGFGGSHDAYLNAVHPDDRARVDRIFRGSLQDHQPFEFTHRMIRPGGDVRHVHAQGHVQLDERGEPRRLIGIAQDVTEQTRLEGQLLQAQKRETLGRLVSGVAHDFNNLLTAISGYTDLVLERVEAASPQRADLLEVRKAAERAAALTRQLLMFSHRQALEPQDISLNAVIEAIGPMLRRLIGDKITMTAVLAPDLAGITADVSHVEQILVNLVVNARDAMATGGRLTIETKNAGPYVRLAVSDTGCGMDDDIKRHIFEPFFTTKDPDHGTGLGLATIHNIVKGSGGHISVYSEPKRGATFKLYFPTTGALAPPGMPVSEGTLDLPAGAETILLVEDDDVVRHVVRSTLRLQGYEVLDAGNGHQGRHLAAVYPHRIDLVLTDVVMPGLDGPALAAQLRLTRPAIKALFISGYTERAFVQQGLVAAGAPFLEKPFSPAELLEKVRTVLDAEPTLEPAVAKS